MLYDPNWNAKTYQFTLANLIAWLEKQPADQTYWYTDAERCLLGQWVKSIDPEARCCFEGNSFAYHCNGRSVELSAFREIVNKSDATFGAALERARAHLG